MLTNTANRRRLIVSVAFGFVCAFLSILSFAIAHGPWLFKLAYLALLSPSLLLGSLLDIEESLGLGIYAFVFVVQCVFAYLAYSLVAFVINHFASIKNGNAGT